ncbi:acyl carrier protein [Streptomyces sp. NPDC058646]|uniref:acyl carrier protein n=1 Tax=Streptomyces sp. NPDC058646 TaxID=3346574 RepID=UPI003669A601
MTQATSQSAPAYLGRMPDLAALRAEGLEERTRIIERYICRELEFFLDIPPAHRIMTSRQLRSQGVGSIMALQLKRLLEMALGVEVAAADLLRDDSVTEIAAYLAVRLDDSVVGAAQLSGPGGHGR